jgi:translation initiation factor 2 beta subunit (eIF-2beta)/eIF-5
MKDILQEKFTTCEECKNVSKNAKLVHFKRFFVLQMKDGIG